MTADHGTASAAGRGTSRELDVVVLGATGYTGRLVARHLARRAPATGVRWAVAGRDRDRLEQVLRDVGQPVPHDRQGGEDGTGPGVVLADLTDASSLVALAARTRVVLNLAGPYSRTADAVIGACVEAGSSYVDLSGEIPAVARSVRRWHAPAQDAGVAVVQACGFEALPADLAVLIATDAARRHSRHHSGQPVTRVDVTVRTTPPHDLRPGDAVSGGTAQSLLAALADPGARALADPAALVTDRSRARAVRRRSPLRLRPRLHEGRVLGPAVPAAFIDPPVLHRTAAFLAAEDAGHGGDEPFVLFEGSDLGPGRGPAALPRLGLALLLSAGQAALVLASRLPGPARRGLAAALAPVLPGSGDGPAATSLEGWRWSVEATVCTADGAGRPVRETVTVESRGHPGYAATARMLGEVGLLLAAAGAARGRSGHLTPALAVGVEGVDQLAAADLHVTLRSAPSTSPAAPTS